VLEPDTACEAEEKRIVSVLSLFQRVETTTIARSINDSLYAFAYIEAIHLLALAVLGGAALMVDLRLLGILLKDQPVRNLERTVRPWFRGSLAVILVTGLFLFVSLAATKYYRHPYFWVKMYCLAGAVAFTFTVRNPVAAGDPVRSNSLVGRLVGLVSILLWSSVALAGKAIGYIS
jgi:uncharacterized protein DUF6644